VNSPPRDFENYKKWGAMSDRSYRIAICGIYLLSYLFSVIFIVDMIFYIKLLLLDIEKMNDYVENINITKREMKKEESLNFFSAHFAKQLLSVSSTV
jgi:hypothetical protein